MIIQDADEFGLSQLYQLRGRVGRSNRTAYAFLMYRRNKMLKEVAEKRLRAIKEFTELGSGIRIAMRDLEIRGAGNLLGKSQHGQMEAVGYDLYCKMLNEAVRRLKGEELPEQFETAMDVELDAYIPDTYIGNEFQKLDIYKRIASLESDEEAEDMTEELIDRYGDLPHQVENLLYIAGLRRKAHKVFATNVTAKGDTIKVPLYEKAQLSVEKIPLLVQRYNTTLRFQMEPPLFTFSRRPGDRESILKKLETLLSDLESLVEENTEKS
jgi:transcription-repair coupling factor (superfamily II helicase)